MADASLLDSSRVDGPAEGCCACRSIDERDRQPSPPKKTARSRVTFSPRSMLHVYAHDSRCHRNGYYTRDDRRGFGKRALSDAMRVRRLVLAAPGATSKDSFNYLMANKILSLEDIVGLEHLAFGQSASKHVQERRDHVRGVCRRVNELKRDGQATRRLRDFAATSSRKAARRARARAAMAA